MRSDSFIQTTWYSQVYNLCEELKYDSGNFYGRTERFPSDDHHVPPLCMVSGDEVLNCRITSIGRRMGFAS